MKGPFYYRHGDRQVGPLSSAELKQHAVVGQLDRNDRVWTEDAPRGCTAYKISGLFPEPVAGAVAEEEIRTDMPPPQPISSSPLPLPQSSSPPPSAPSASVPPPLPAGVVASDAKLSFANRTMTKLRGVGREGVLSVTACAAQLGRTTTFLRARRGANQAERKVQTALEALGQKLDASGAGDAGLRAQLTQLRERRQSLQAANTSTKLLDAEQRGLWVRLATQWLEIPAPATELSAERDEMHRLQVSLSQAQRRRSEQKLFPDDLASRFRVVFGCLIAILVVGFGSRWFLGGGLFAKGTWKEVLWVEDEDFPRRLAVGRFDGDDPVGNVKLFDEQKRLMVDANYEGGVFHGKCTFYYPNGSKFNEGGFDRGRRTGTHYFWFPDGTPSETAEMDGQGHGKTVMYYKNGSKFSEGDTEDGKRVGQWVGYAPDGRRASIIKYENGEVVKAEDLFPATDDIMRAIDERGKFPVKFKQHWQ